MPPKKKKTKGRPPKYVLDKKGREIVGLGYNKANNQYYLTFTNPREYLGSSKEKAIKEFYQRRVYEQLPLNAQQEQQHKDDIYSKALELLKYDDSIQELIQDKARAEIQKILLETIYIKNYYRNFERKEHFKEEISELKEPIVSAFIRKIRRVQNSEITVEFAKEALNKIIDRYLTPHHFSSKKLNQDIAKTFESFLDEHLKHERFMLRLEKERLEDLTGAFNDSENICPKGYICIKKSPIYLSKDSPFHVKMPLPWWLAWDIYNIRKPKKTEYNYEGFWNCIGAYVGYFDSIDQVSKKQLIEAIRFLDSARYNPSSISSLAKRYDQDLWKVIEKKIGNVNAPYFPSPHEAKRILRSITKPIYKAGYRQVLHIIKIIEDPSFL